MHREIKAFLQHVQGVLATLRTGNLPHSKNYAFHNMTWY